MIGNTPRKDHCYYPLNEVRELIEAGKYHITALALRSALREFGWKAKDIIDCIMELEDRHFYKNGQCTWETKIVYDIYKRRGFRGENIYTHFYIDDDKETLVIDSFKGI